jgi:hypothetical protein
MISKTNFSAAEDRLSALLRTHGEKNNRELQAVTGGVFETINSLARAGRGDYAPLGKVMLTVVPRPVSL